MAQDVLDSGKATAQPPVPNSLAQIDADWLTRCLRTNGIDTSVTKLDMRPVGTGQMAHCVRMSLTYGDQNSSAPATLIAKVPSPHEHSRNSGAGANGFYMREVHFYENLARDARIRTPKCFYAGHHGESGDFALILEDLSPAVQGDQIAGVTLAQASDVMIEAARLHASHWDDPAIDALPWVTGTKAEPPQPDPTEQFRAMWRGFCDRFKASLELDAKCIGDRVFATLPTYIRGYVSPRCLIHNDFRPDNMMFATERGGYPVTVVDWQTLGYGQGASDVSYFLSGALAPDQRRAHERDLLKIYFDELLANGVGNFSLDQLYHDYAWHGTKLLFSAVAGAMMVEPTARGNEMFMTMFHGAADQITTWDGLKIIEACV